MIRSNESKKIEKKSKAGGEEGLKATNKRENKHRKTAKRERKT